MGCGLHGVPVRCIVLYVKWCSLLPCDTTTYVLCVFCAEGIFNCVVLMRDR